MTNMTNLHTMVATGGGKQTFTVEGAMMSARGFHQAAGELEALQRRKQSILPRRVTLSCLVILCKNRYVFWLVSNGLYFGRHRRSGYLGSVPLFEFTGSPQGHSQAFPQSNPQPASYKDHAVQACGKVHKPPRMDEHHMSEIMIHCSTLGTAVPTGLTADKVIFETLPPVPIPVECPACRKVHKWKPAEAWVQGQQTCRAGNSN
jgi:hypothetical protein